MSLHLSVRLSARLLKIYQRILIKKISGPRNNRIDFGRRRTSRRFTGDRPMTEVKATFNYIMTIFTKTRLFL